jgi:hypothetical protein
MLTRTDKTATIDQQLSEKVQSLLEKADLLKDKGKDKGKLLQVAGVPTPKKEDSAAFAMFICLVEVLTGEELAPEHCCLCMELLLC